MKRLLCTLLLLVGCRETVDVAQTKRAGTTFVEPIDATDLDPDPNVVRVALTASALAPGGAYAYAYNATNPGPTLRAKVGDRLIVELTNDLGAPTTIHWHGVAVPFEMDGVTWMRGPVAPGATFTYQFDLPTAGTFWYHPHFDTERQVEGGLYGALIVEDPAEPAPDRELVLIVDAVDELAPGQRAHGHGKLVTRWRVNGVETPTLTLAGGTAVRARVINASNVGILALRYPGLSQIGSDQGLLPSRRTTPRLKIGPGDRVDVEIAIGMEDVVLEADAYSLNGGDAWGDPTTLMRIEVMNPTAPPAPIAWPFPGGAVTPDPGYADIVYAFAGSDRSRDWMINGERFPNVTIETIPLGGAAIVDVTNLSPSEHPFHVHGLTFEVLAVNGVAPEMRTVEDTIMLAIRDRVRLRIDGDNPGDWMTHCHILPHAEEGMMTVLRVE